QVTTPSGTSSAVTADHFTYSAASAPALTAISPSSGTTAGGTVVQLTGSGFTGATGVSFGGVAAAGFVVNSDTLVTAVSPVEAAGPWDVPVTAPGGTSAAVSADRFSVSAATAPAITSLSPTSGSTAGGTVVTLTGTNFTGASSVLFGGTPAASFVVNSDTSI